MYNTKCIEFVFLIMYALDATLRLTMPAPHKTNEQEQAELDPNDPVLQSLLHSSDPKRTLADLIKEMDKADDAATSLESKLDALLGNLDSMLNAHEKKQTATVSEAESSKDTQDAH